MKTVHRIRRFAPLTIFLFMTILRAQEVKTANMGTYVFAEKTHEGNEWIVELRNLALKYELKGYASKPDDRSIVGRGFRDDAYVRLWFSYSPVDRISYGGRTLPLADVNEGEKISFMIYDVVADVYSGGTRVNTWKLPMNGFVQGMLVGDKTKLSSAAPSWKNDVLNVDSHEEVVRLVNAGLTLRNIRIERATISSREINGFVDNLAASESAADLIVQADHLYQQNRYEEALQAYRDANKLKRNNRVTQRIKDVQGKIRETNQDGSREESTDSEATGSTAVNTRGSTGSPGNRSNVSGPRYTGSDRSRQEKWARRLAENRRRRTAQILALQRQIDEAQQKKIQAIEDFGKEMTDILRRSSEQKRESEGRRRLGWVNKIMREITRRAEEQVTAHERVLDEIADITSRHSGQLSPATLDAVDRVISKGQERLIDSRYRKIKQWQRQYEDDMNMMTDPADLQVGYYESELETSRKSAQKPYENYGLPTLLWEAYKDTKENAAAGPYYVALAEKHLDLAIAYARYATVVEWGTRLVEVDQEKGRSYATRVENARKVLDANSAVRDENTRRRQIMEESKQQNATLVLTEDGPYTITVHNPVDITFNLSAATAATIEEGRKVTNVWSRGTPPSFKLVDYGQSMAGLALVPPGTATVTLKKRWHKAATKSFPVRAGRRYTVDAQRYKYVRDGRSGHYGGIDFGENPRSDEILVEQAIYGPALFPDMKFGFEAGLSGSAQHVRLPLMTLGFLNAHDLLVSSGSLYYGVNIDLTMGTGSQNQSGVTMKYLSIPYSTDMEQSWTWIGGDIGLSGGWLGYVSEQMALNVEATLVASYASVSLTEKRSSVTVAPESDLSNSIQAIGVGFSFGPDIHLGSLTLSPRYEIRIGEFSAGSDIGDLPTWARTEEQERLQTLFSDIWKSSMGSYFAVGVRF